MTWPKPETEAIRAALRHYAPHIADDPIELLGEGWSVWAFTAGEYVLRFPKREAAVPQMELEEAVLPIIAETVTVELPQASIHGRFGPEDAPFIGHHEIKGVPLMEAGVRPETGFAYDLGHFLRELHSVPFERLIKAGVPLLDGPRLRGERGHHYEDVIRRCFPLISCEARTYMEQVYEVYLNDATNFEFDPCLVHGDLDSNTLIDPDSGKLVGVIDFGDVTISNPAHDSWMPVFCLPRLGIGSQLDECFGAADVSPQGRQRMQKEIDFILARFPLVDMLHGLDTGEDYIVEGGIRELNASLPADLRCD